MQRLVSLIPSSKMFGSTLRMASDLATSHFPFVPQRDYESRAKTFFELEEVDSDTFKTNTLSTGRQGSSRAAYGGLIFSQALAAAEKTVEDRLKPHALHSLFINSVETTIPIVYKVRRIRDGRSFCSRSVEAIQNDKIAFTLQVSFHTEEPDSTIHQDAMPNVPHWSECMSYVDGMTHIEQLVDAGSLKVPDPVAKRIKGYDKKAYHGSDLFEIRPTDLAKHFAYGDNTSRTLHMWFRSRGDLVTDCERLHRYLVCFNTDTIAGCVFRPHYQNNFNPSLVFSLDHNVWIHNPKIRADQWLLFENHSPFSGKSRGMSIGRLFTESGELVMSCAQEILIRSRGETSRL